MKNNDSKALFSHNKGSVLVIVLVFSAIISTVALTLMQSALLQYRMVSNYKSYLNFKKEIDKKIILCEKNLDKQFNGVNCEKESVKLSKLQFVPDTLHFQESEGVQYDQLTQSPAIATYAVRAYHFFTDS